MMMVVACILAFIYLKMSVQRIKGGKLVSVISWLVIIGFAIIHFLMLADDISEIEEIFSYSPNILLLIIEGIILLIINLLTIKNKFKAIILTFSQLGISVIGVIALIVIIFGLFASAGQSTSGGSNSKWTKQFSQTKGEYYTDGHGNFKDQNGNDVYNPQGVTDYDKL
ncbi:MAG: hypothetical protein NC094_05600 [Bacteroidales bacterium]|nr:hypothetical protein [Lachnoclostridium sp.]MCM1464877.1 hypothetical protein [Bacteroidales bacterium]